jgi:hypothetical protein
MKRIACLFLIPVIALSGCKMFGNDKDKKKDPAAKKPSQAELREENADVDFQAFVSRLKKAVSGHDTATLASMMAEDFLYVLAPDEAQDRKGDGVFKYWDENGLWTELDGILTERFAKKDNVWVAPPQWADPSLNYTGYRAGVSRVKGSWKFVYFVTGTSN